MSTIKAIRERINLTQAQLGEQLGCTQGNVWHYEHGQEIQPDTAKKLIEVAKARGLHLTLDQVYGLEPLPPKPSEPAVAES